MRNVLFILFVMTLAPTVVWGALLADPNQPYHNKGTYGGVVAQSFTSTQDYIYKIDLLLYTASPGYIAQLEVKGGASDYVTPSTPGLVSLGSKTVDLGTWPNQGNYYWVTFDFSDNPIDIRNYNGSKGTARLIFFLTNGGSNLVIYRYYMPNIYGPGQWFIDGTLMNGDMAFTVWTDMVVPEPATLALLAMGGSVLMLNRKK